MLAEHDGHGLQSVTTEFHLERMLRTADEQLGRILDAINQRGLADRTLIVVTADHGGQKNDVYLGNNGSQSCCPFENATNTSHAALLARSLEQDRQAAHGLCRIPRLRCGLTTGRRPTKRVLTRGLMDVSGITEIWALRRGGTPAFRYERVHSRLDAQPAKFRAWANRHSAELLATMAGPAAPDLVGFLQDGYGFGRIGDHGGAQELVQRIPMIIHVPGEAPSTRWTPLRLMDLSTGDRTNPWYSETDPRVATSLTFSLIDLLSHQRQIQIGLLEVQFQPRRGAIRPASRRIGAAMPISTFVLQIRELSARHVDLGCQSCLAAAGPRLQHSQLGHRGVDLFARRIAGAFRSSAHRVQRILSSITRLRDVTTSRFVAAPTLNRCCVARQTGPLSVQRGSSARQLELQRSATKSCPRPSGAEMVSCGSRPLTRTSSNCDWRTEPRSALR